MRDRSALVICSMSIILCSLLLKLFLGISWISKYRPSEATFLQGELFVFKKQDNVKDAYQNLVVDSIAFRVIKIILFTFFNFK